MRSLLAVCIVLCWANTASADFVWYILRGELPNGSTNHQFIQDGETFEARFLVDLSTPDENDFDGFGQYSDTAIHAEISFSGGYELDMSDSPTRVQVADNIPLSGNEYDVVFIWTHPHLRFAAVNGLDLSSLTSDALPTAGTMFDSGPTPLEPLQIPTFVFSDQFGGWAYRVEDANNISFEAVAPIPEPHATGLLALLMFVFGCRRALPR